VIKAEGGVDLPRGVSKYRAPFTSRQTTAGEEKMWRRIEEHQESKTPGKRLDASPVGSFLSSL
jgi:hypothetical protein